MSKITPVILSGGSGTRLWPFSRSLYPKQLQALYSERSMLQETAARVSGAGFADPVIICNQEHRFIIAEQLLEVEIKPSTIMLEPVGRNTAPAAAIAALYLVKENPDALMMVMPSDHMIANEEAFNEACGFASEAATLNYLVTFGIQPKGPETGYGYVQQGLPLGDLNNTFSVTKFVEKPDSRTARQYLESGEYSWNSGIFLFKASAFLAELEQLQPDMLRACRLVVDKALRDLDFTRFDEQLFCNIPSNSIDFAIMEHTNKAAIVPVGMGWNDVGSWSELWQVSHKDAEGNVCLGNVVLSDVHDSYIRTSGPLTAAIGVRDLIVVVTDDAVLVLPKDRSQDVKTIVTLIKDQGGMEGDSHLRVHRPWGWYQSIDSGVGFQAKQLMVKPGGVLSLQRHQKRSEHWVVVAGMASITRDDQVFELKVGESTYISKGTMHRLENASSEPLRIIEVQTGSYLGEDDIERFDDLYGRKISELE